MRTFFAQVETRYRAIKNCPFTPAHVVMEYNMITAEAQQYINDNGLDNELYDVVCDWLSENSYPEPNYLDYSENDLNDFLQKLK